MKVSPRSSASGLQTRKECSEEDFVRGFLGAKSRDIASVFCPHSPGQNRVTWPNLTAWNAGKDIQLDAQEGEEMEFGGHRATPPHCCQLLCGQFLVLPSRCSLVVTPRALFSAQTYASVSCSLPSASCLSTPLVPSLSPETSRWDVFFLVPSFPSPLPHSGCSVIPHKLSRFQVTHPAGPSRLGQLFPSCIR